MRTWSSQCTLTCTRLKSTISMWNARRWDSNNNALQKLQCRLALVALDPSIVADIPFGLKLCVSGFALTLADIRLEGFLWICLPVCGTYFSSSTRCIGVALILWSWWLWLGLQVAVAWGIGPWTFTDAFVRLATRCGRLPG